MSLDSVLHFGAVGTIGHPLSQLCGGGEEEEVGGPAGVPFDARLQHPCNAREQTATLYGYARVSR